VNSRDTKPNLVDQTISYSNAHLLSRLRCSRPRVWTLSLKTKKQKHNYII